MIGHDLPVDTGLAGQIRNPPQRLVPHVGGVTGHAVTGHDKGPGYEPGPMRPANATPAWLGRCLTAAARNGHGPTADREQDGTDRE